MLNKLSGFSGCHGPRKVIASVCAALILLSSLSLIIALQQEGDSADGSQWIPARTTAIIASSFVITPTSGYVGTELTFTASATSDLGTVLNFTIYYDYVLANGSVNPSSPVSHNTTGNPGSIVTHYVYAAPGNLTGNSYRVRLEITDGTGAIKVLTRVVYIYLNRVPYFSPDLGPGLDAQAGIALNMSVTCWDADNESLNLTWDFGDGSEPVVQYCGPSALGVVCNQTHVWNPDPTLWYGVGDPAPIYPMYYVNLSLSDEYGHVVNTTTLVSIYLDHNFSPQGNLTANVTIADPGDPVNICGAAWDVEGEPLTWTFFISNSTQVISTAVFHTALTSPGQVVFQNVTYIFSEAGNYSVTLYLTDLALLELQTDPDFAAHNISIGTIYLSSVINRIPDVLANITVKDVNTGLQDVWVNDTSGVATAFFSIEALDRDGEVLTATWDYGDGSNQSFNVSSAGVQVWTFSQVHTYQKPGQYNVSVIVTDGRPGHEVLRYKLVSISSNNSAPKIKDLKIILSNSSYGEPGSVVQFVLILYDLERNPLTVMWVFGDGSPVEWTNVSAFDETGNATCFMNHTYSVAGKYDVWVNFTDGIYGREGLNNGSWSALVVIDTKASEVFRVWNWWDYASLSIFLLAIALLVMWGLWGTIRRRQLDKMGTTMEEYILRKKELKDYDERHEGGRGEQ